MKKLSLSDLKAKSEEITSLETMNKITGGNKANCHSNVQKNRAWYRDFLLFPD